MDLAARLRGVSVRPRAVLMLTEAALVGLLGVQAVRLAWTLAAPPADVLARPAASAARPVAGGADLLARFDPFFRIVGDASSEDSAPADLQLYGVRAGGGGSAILGPPGGAQNLYAVGERLPGGQVLAAVAADHVILSHGGARRRLDFPNAPSSAAPSSATYLPPPPAAAAGPAAAGGYSGAELAAALALAPRMREGRTAGYTVAPRGAQGAAILAKAGLAPGDVILTVDGSELNQERFSELPAILAAAGHVQIAYERGGQTFTTTLRMTAP